MNSESKPPGKNTPWYRHRWPWILMAGPFVAVVASSITAYLAVVSNDGLVDEDYYTHGMNVNRTSARDKAAATLGVHAVLMQDTAGLRLRVLLRAGTVLPREMSLRITHPTRPGVDQTVSLLADGDGSYAGTLTRPLAGRWHVALEDADHNWRLTGDWTVEQEPVLRLPAESRADMPGSSPAP